MSADSKPSRPAVRIGDEEREDAARALSEHYARGRLTTDEFEERLAAAYAAKTVVDLEPLVADLPVLPAKGPTAEHPADTEKTAATAETAVRPTATPPALRADQIAAAKTGLRIALTFVAPMAVIMACVGTILAIVNGLADPAVATLITAGALSGVSVLLGTLLRTVDHHAKPTDTG